MQELINLANKEAKLKIEQLESALATKSDKGRLIFLYRKLSWYQSNNISPIPAFNYELKHKLVSAVLNDEEISLNKKDLELSFKNFQTKFTAYQSVLQNTDDSEIDILDDVLFPNEIVSTAKENGKEKIEDIRFEELVVKILVNAKLEQHIELIFNDTLESLQFTEEDFKKLSDEYGTRLNWLGNGMQLAYLIDSLRTNDWLQFPSEKPELSNTNVAAIILAHFHVSNTHSSKKKDVSLTSMTTYVKDAKKNVFTEFEIKPNTI